MTDPNSYTRIIPEHLRRYRNRFSDEAVTVLDEYVSDKDSVTYIEYKRDKPVQIPELRLTMSTFVKPKYVFDQTYERIEGGWV